MPAHRLTYRARVLAVVNASPGWLTARDIAAQASLTYLQTIYALNALLNTEALARQGRKSTARWGSLVLVEHSPTSAALATLESILNRRA
jgi:hypothetical protein